MNVRRPTGVAVFLCLAASPLAAQLKAPLDTSLVKAFEWRSIGPANMGGRTTDIEGIGSPSKTIYVATAAGGIWKTTNNGITFRPLFTDQRVISMGDLAIAPSDTLQIWAGTGEEDTRNSISPGGGIYKSVDGGVTWKLMGLEATQAIARIVVHPTNPDIVYVAALGHIWDSNPERGLYRTTDGGRTWTLSKFISDKAGFSDVAMDPSNPNVLFASSWERVRGPYFLQSGGPGSALWKTTDAGTTWTEVKGGGFPETMKGRIGIAIARSNPRIVYALVEAEPKDGKTTSGLYRSNDGGSTWAMMNDNNTRPFYYSQVRVDPKNPDRVYWSSTPVNFSDDGGKTVKQGTLGIHVDHHAMWIDPNDPDHFLVGDDGGVSQTWDKGGNYDFINTMAIGQFYAISYDMAVPYRVCGGLQDNGSWCGPSRRADGPITNAMWFNAGGGDGFHTAQDPTDPNTIYSESQAGNMGRYDLRSGDRTSLQKPNWRDSYTMWEDSILIARGDTMQPASAALTTRIADLRTRQVNDSTRLDLRWNWNTPFFLSPHDPNVFYAAANRVLKSTKKGDDLTPISPDLTTQDTMRIRVSTRTTGGVTRDVTGAETYATIVSLNESPVRKGLLLAGTDDGNVWMSRNDGGDWENLTARFRGLVPPLTYVSRIEPSHFDENTFYITFDGHRTNDFTPYAFVTTDGGKTFRSIAKGLPTGAPDFVHVIREDPHNRNLLFLGTDVGLYMSADRGATWQRFMEGLPTVPVHDLRIHPRDHELIAGTHGRSIWIADIGPLEQLTDQVIADAAYLFDPRPAFQYGEPPVGGESAGHRWFEASSPQYGAEITYYLSAPSKERPSIVVTSASGDTVQTLNGPNGKGLHRVSWNFRGQPAPPDPLSPSERRDSVRNANRIDFVADSLVKAGMDKALVDRATTALRGGGGFGRGGGGGRGQGGGDRGWVERPGESAGGGGRGAGGAGGVDQETLRDIARLINPGGGRGGFGGGRGGRGGASVVDPGDYTVTLVAGGKSMSRKLTVTRINGSGGSGFGFEEEEEGGERR